MTDEEIKAQVRSGRWRTIEPGLYVVVGSPVTREQQLWLALLGAAERAVLSHQTAGALYGIVERGAEIHVTVLNGKHHRGGPRRVVHQARTFGRGERTTIGEFPATTPKRTLVDLAGALSAFQLEAALDTALMRKLVTVDGLLGYIERNRLTSLKGMGLLRRLLNDRRRGVPQEEMERFFERNVVRRFKLPKPKRQWPFAGNKRIDAAYPDEKIAIELDSWTHHGSLSAFRADRPRQNILELDGWMVLRFTWDAVRYRPHEVAETILTALGRRGRALASPTRPSRSRGSG